MVADEPFHRRLGDSAEGDAFQPGRLAYHLLIVEGDGAD